MLNNEILYPGYPLQFLFAGLNKNLKFRPKIKKQNVITVDGHDVTVKVTSQRVSVLTKIRKMWKNRIYDIIMAVTS